MFFFNDTAPTEIYTLSLHDALPISFGAPSLETLVPLMWSEGVARRGLPPTWMADRKSTRLNSSHVSISYAVFCLKKKNPTNLPIQHSCLNIDPAIEPLTIRHTTTAL